MLRNLIRAIALLGAFTSLSAVSASAATGDDPSAVYTAYTAGCGNLHIAALPGTAYQVMSEQADGSYLPTAVGVVGSQGTADRCVAKSGSDASFSNFT